MASTISETEFAYNGIGRITDANEMLFGGTKRQMDYTYDQAGFLTSTKYPNATTTVNITPDWQGRIDTVRLGSTLAVYKYIGSRVAERNYPYMNPDVTYRAAYDNLGRITSGRTFQSSTDIVKFDYQYDPNTNNITKQTYDHRTSDPAVDFTYDNLDRLTMAEYGIQDNNEVFTIDALGNSTNVNLHSGSDESYSVDNLTNCYNSVGGYFNFLFTKQLRRFMLINRSV